MYITLFVGRWSSYAGNMALIDGSTEPREIRKALISEALNLPILFGDYINHWGARCWSPEFFATHKQLSKSEVLFRVSENSGTGTKRRRVGIVMFIYRILTCYQSHIIIHHEEHISVSWSEFISQHFLWKFLSDISIYTIYIRILENMFKIIYFIYSV